MEVVTFSGGNRTEFDGKIEMPAQPSRVSPPRARIIAAVFACAVAALCGRAETVSSDLVVRAVDGWVAQKAQMGAAISGTVSSVRLCTAPNGASFYVARLTGGGFVVTSTDTELDPVVAFSEAPDLVEDSRNPLWSLLVGDMALRRRALPAGDRARTSGSAGGAAKAPVSPAAARWARLAATSGGAGRAVPSSAGSGTAGRASISDVRVAPLLRTKWGQESARGGLCFNYYTPRHYPCGCTATAGAQILRYHKFPTEAVEPEEYECEVDGRMVEFRQMGGVYDWQNMPEVPSRGMTSVQRQAIGKLTYDVSLAVGSSYSEDETWGYADLLVELLENWGYAHGSIFHYYDNVRDGGFTEREMKSVLIPNLDARLPVGVRIYDLDAEDDTAHFVVADGYGYSDGLFSVHLNMGWDGDYDAWYVLPEMDVGGDLYTTVNYMVGNIYPSGPEFGGIASGRVVSDEDGASPLPGIAVTATDAYGQVLRTTTDEHGIYAFLLEEGEWEIGLEGYSSKTYSFWMDDVDDVEEVIDDYDEDDDDEDEVEEAFLDTWTGNYHGLDFTAGDMVSNRVMTVTFDSNGGSEVKPVEVNEGDPLGTLPATTRTGYTFDGWFVRDGVQADARPVDGTGVVTNDMVVYAGWTPNVYTVTFDANGGAEVPAREVVYGVAYGELPATTRAGYTFHGWTDGEGHAVSADTVFATAANVTLAASWSANAAQVSLSDGSVIDTRTGAEIALPASIDSLGHVLVGWTDGTATYIPGGTYVVPAAGADLKAVLEAVELHPAAGDGLGGDVAVPYATAAVVYDGYLRKGGLPSGTIQVKVAKLAKGAAKVTATVQLGGRKLTFKGGMADETGAVAPMSAGGHTLALALGRDGLHGGLDGVYAVDGARNFFSSKDRAEKSGAEALLKNVQGAVNVVLPDGRGILTVSIAAKGGVRVSGTVGGAKVSAASQLLIGADVCAIPVVIAKKAELALVVWMDAAGSVAVDGIEGAVAGRAGAPRAGAAFRCGAAALAKALPGLYADYLPDGLPVTQTGAKWIVAGGAKAGKVDLDRKTGEVDETKLGANPSGLKLAYKAKDGSFKGSFKAYALEKGKVRAYVVNVEGVMVGGVGHGTATLKKPAVSLAVTVE